MIPLHPMRLLAKLGVSDGPAGISLFVVVGLQYLFLAKLWEGYPIRSFGDAIDGTVVIALGLLSLGGAIVIVYLSIRSWIAGAVAGEMLEKPAAHRSFEGIRQALAIVTLRSTLSSVPDLRYTARNGNALEVRDRGGADAPTIVIGLDQREYQRVQPVAFSAMLGHEVSHLEMASTRFEIVTRRIVFLHLRVLAWLVATFALLLGFVDRSGSGSATGPSGIAVVFDPLLYSQLTPQFFVLTASSVVIVFVYSYFLIVRREHMHDFRGSQLAGNAALADAFEARRVRIGRSEITDAIGEFLKLHPSPKARVRTLQERDLLVLSCFLYPFAMSMLLPFAQLLGVGWSKVFAIPESAWTLGWTIATGLFLYSVLRADLARFGLGLLLWPKRYLTLMIAYAGAASLGTQMPRVVLETVFGLRKGLPPGEILERIWSGGIAGGSINALMIGAIVLVLGLSNAIRIAATGEARAGESSIVDRFASACLVIAAFMIASLNSLSYISVILLVCAAIAAYHAGWFAVRFRCEACGSRRFAALRLRTTCACGHEHLPMVRLWMAQPFAMHLAGGVQGVKPWVDPSINQ